MRVAVPANTNVSNTNSTNNQRRCAINRSAQRSTKMDFLLFTTRSSFDGFALHRLLCLLRDTRRADKYQSCISSLTDARETVATSGVRALECLTVIFRDSDHTALTHQNNVAFPGPGPTVKRSGSTRVDLLPGHTEI